MSTSIVIGEFMQVSYYYVSNNSGSDILKGSVVGVSGTLPLTGKILVAPFLADGTYPSNECIGIVADDIPDGADGMVLHFGILRGIDTSMYTDGDKLYVSDTISGGYTTIQPTAPNNIIHIATVVKADASGIIHVRPFYGSNINNDEGVLISSPANGEVLMYNSTTGLWYNGVVSGGGGSTTWGTITGTLSSQTDLQSALNLKYDASNPAGYIDAAALAPYLTTTTAAATYYPLTNPSGYISGITSGDVTTALGYTPYNSSNPAGYIDSSALTPYLTNSTAAATYYPLTNPSGYITGIVSSDVTTALGYTPYDSSNPSGYIDSSALTPYLTSATALATYYPLTNPSGYISGIASGDVTTALGYTPVPDTNTVTINGNTQTLGSNPSFTVSGADPGGWTTIVKSANQDVTNDNNLQDDTELQFSVVAGGRYMIEMDIIWSANDATGDYKFDYALSNGTMIAYGFYYTYNNVRINNVIAVNQQTSADVVLQTITANIDTPIPLKLVIPAVINDNATFTFRFSNSSAGATRTSRTWKGSILRYKRID